MGFSQAGAVAILLARRALQFGGGGRAPRLGVQAITKICRVTGHTINLIYKVFPYASTLHANCSPGHAEAKHSATNVPPNSERPEQSIRGLEVS